MAYPADEGGCGAYRIIWPAEALAAGGADVELIRPGDDHQMMAKWQRDATGREHVVDVVPPDADVVVMQRPLMRGTVDGIVHLQRHGVRVVVEVDDDFASIHPRNVSFANVNPSVSPDRNHLHLMRACSLADHVVVTTPALARRYGRHGRFSIVPNHVPARYLDVTPEPHDGVFVGWTGSIDTHPTDLQVTRGGVAQAVRDTGARFAVVGTGKGVQRALGLDVAPLVSGWAPLDRYPEAMAQLDVGIVPLDDIVFNHGKSWLKGLEMAAVGVPFVASPTDDYVRLAKLGAGLLATRARDWRRFVGELVGDEHHRAEAAGRGRDLARRWTIEGNSERWWDAWTAPLRARRAA